MAVQENSQLTSCRNRRYQTGFPVRCTEAEKQEIFARAERANRSASRFLVEFVLANGANGIRSRPSPEELVALEGVMVQLRRLANTLQQLLSREQAAVDEDSDLVSAADLDEAVLEVRRILDQLRSRLA